MKDKKLRAGFEIGSQIPFFYDYNHCAKWSPTRINAFLIAYNKSEILIKAEEIRTVGKRPRGRCTRHTPPPGPLRTDTFEAWYPPALLLWPVPPTNFAPFGGRSWTISRGCGRVLTGERHPSRHPTADLRSYQNWSWHLQLLHTSQPPSSQPRCPIGGTQKRWYHQRTQTSSSWNDQQSGLNARPDLPPHF